MHTLCHPWLINDPFEDPGLYVDILGEKRSLLFDIGSLNNLPMANLLKVSDVFVSHTHIDHFIGFDQLLRYLLRREKPLRLFGPPGFIKNINGKLSGYTWNLVDKSPFVITVYEIHEDYMQKNDFICSERFKVNKSERVPFNGVVLEDPLFTVECNILEHRIPSVAYSLREKNSINIRKDAFQRSGFVTGPWLNILKEKIHQGHMDEELSAPIPDGNRLCYIRELKEMFVTITKGKKISYVVDTVYNEENAKKIVSLIKGSDLLFIEAMFSEEDSEKGRQRCHLTARQAAEIGRQAKVKEIRVFHHSQRYINTPLKLSIEAEKYFSAGINT